MKPEAKTWSQLKAEGVRRCCAMFKDGTRCRRRVLTGVYDGWCAKHGPIMKAHTAAAMRALKQESKK